MFPFNLVHLLLMNTSLNQMFPCYSCPIAFTYVFMLFANKINFKKLFDLLINVLFDYCPDDEPDEPRLTVLTKQHKNAIRSLRKVGKLFFEKCITYLMSILDQIFCCKKKVQRSTQTI